MEELSFNDVLTHYQLKIREASEEVEAVRNLLRKAQTHMDAGWAGPAADACRIKLETLQADLTKTLADLSEALNSLTAIGEAAAEEIIPVI